MLEVNVTLNNASKGRILGSTNDGRLEKIRHFQALLRLLVRLLDSYTVFLLIIWSLDVQNRVCFQSHA